MNCLSPEVKTVARKFYRAIGTLVSHRLLKALEAEDWATIATAKVSPADYSSSQDYFLDASAVSFLKKYSGFPTAPELRRHQALKIWGEGEAQCFRTNERLAPYLEGFTHPDYDVRVGSHIEALQKEIADLLGGCPSMDDLQPRFGPGATFSDQATVSTVPDKISRPASLTHNAFWFLLDWVGTSWGRESLSVYVNPFPVRGNRYAVAPKDAVKDRSIAAEPSINIFYQLAVGQKIRHRLKRRGIDLDVAQNRHRQVARDASISGLSATLDLSNASDTMAWSLVKLLLPYQWFNLLNQLRSPFTRMNKDDCSAVLGRTPWTVGDHWIKLEKFSSMGNGFTFELESLLFYAIADYASRQSLATTDDMQPTLVFGDDIICDSRGVQSVISLLQFLGFRTNDTKSFVSGPFRESCGGDFWAGRPVRPFNLKESLDEPQQLIACANGIYRLAQDLFGGLGALSGVWHYILDQIPSRIRQCRGPSWLGDAVIHDVEDNWSWTSLGKNAVFGYVPAKYREVDVANWPDWAIHASGLYGLDIGKGFIIPRDSVSGYRIKKIPIVGTDWLPKPAAIRDWDVPVTGPLARTGPDYSRAVRVPGAL